MSDYWNDKGLYCVENCKNQGLPITASYVNEIVKQRAELLEALKSLHENVLGNSGMWGSYFASPVFVEVTNAIAKAEAAE